MTRIPYEIQLPRNKNEIRKYYIESKFSICDNLPIPHIENLANHAYISPIDIIRNILGHGLPLDTIKEHSLNNKETSPLNISRISQSAIAQDIFKNSINRFQNNMNTIVLWINEWSDDFDPNDSIKTLNSVWMKTITISVPHKITKNSHLYTYPVSVGLKSSNHEEVEEKFAKDLKLLSKGQDLKPFYYAALGTFVNVHAEIFVTLQDQPERRGANYIMLGNGRYTSRFGYAIDLLQLSDKIPACTDCFYNTYALKEIPSISKLNKYNNCGS